MFQKKGQPVELPIQSCLRPNPRTSILDNIQQEKVVGQNENINQPHKHVPESGKIIPSSKVIEDEGKISMIQMSEIKDDDFESGEKKCCWIQFSQEFQNIGEVLKAFAESMKFKHERKEDKKQVVQEEGLLIQIKKVLKLCFPNQLQREIYELKAHPQNKQKAKFVQISGDPQKFIRFKDRFFCQLWKHQYIKVQPKEAVRYFLLDKNDLIHQLKREISVKENVDIDGIMQRVKKVKFAQELLKRDLQNFVKLNQKYWAEKKLAEFFYHEVPLFDQIGKAKAKNIFEQKKRRVLSAMSTKEIFQYAELKSQYQLILKAKQQQRPYDKGIKLLEELKVTLSPTSLIELISQFQNELKIQYNIYHKNEVKVSQQNENFQILIICLLLCKNSCLWEIILILSCYFEAEPTFIRQNKLLNQMLRCIQNFQEKWVI